MRHFSSILCLIGFINSLVAQSPATDHAWLNTDNISVRITPTGILADSTGGFLLNGIGGQPVNLLSHLTPWIGGIDPAGNLKLACELDYKSFLDWRKGFPNQIHNLDQVQVNDPPLTDWQPGFSGVPNSNKVWKVTSNQISAHISDFQDNGVVDNPIPEIFSWPARGNTFSLAYNGFEITNDWSSSITAQFFDKDDDGYYNPENGDYPALVIRGGGLLLFPEQIGYSTFFNDTTGALTHGKSVHTQASLQAFTFNCNQNDFMENTVFLAYRFQSIDIERTDSAFVCLYSDFNIGEPSDDYLGCALPSPPLIYAYNSDTLFDATAGQYPPMLGLNFFRGPLDSNGIEVHLKKTMPMLANSQNQTDKLPYHPQEFYNFITGSWKDGTPLTYGGTGYGGNMVADFPYPDNPSDANGWSELSADNPLGDRRVLASYGPLSILPGTVNETIISLTASKAAGPTAQLEELKQFKYLQNILLNGHSWLDTVLHELCFPQVRAVEPNKENSIFIFPNPAVAHVTLHSSGDKIRAVMLFDVLGKIALNKHIPTGENQDVLLDIAGIPPGIYTLHWILGDGQRGAEKVVVAR